MKHRIFDLLLFFKRPSDVCHCYSITKHFTLHLPLNASVASSETFDCCQCLSSLMGHSEDQSKSKESTIESLSLKLTVSFFTPRWKRWIEADTIPGRASILLLKPFWPSNDETVNIHHRVAASAAPEPRFWLLWLHSCHLYYKVSNELATEQNILRHGWADVIEHRRRLSRFTDFDSKWIW